MRRQGSTRLDHRYHQANPNLGIDTGKTNNHAAERTTIGLRVFYGIADCPRALSVCLSQSQQPQTVFYWFDSRPRLAYFPI